MSRKNIQDIYKLSPIQKGMLFHTVYTPGSEAYFDQFVMRFLGLDLDSYLAVWLELLERHPILRTSFLWENLDEPVQIVHKEVEIPHTVEDLTDLPQEEQERVLHQRVLEDRRKGFDMKRAPLMRFTVLRFGDEDIRVIWSYHHILLDGWSVGLVLQETLAFYRGHEEETTVTLPPAPRPFKDYVRWLAKQDLSEAETYWRRRLGTFDTPNPLPFDGDTTGAFGELEEPIGAELDATLRAMARTQRVTFFNLAQAAWALTLARYGGSDDVVFGMTLSGRPAALKGVQKMVGCFINTLPVRTRIRRDGSLLDWLKRLQKDYLELIKFEYSPLGQVQSWSGVKADRNLFDSLLVSEGFMAIRDYDSHQRTNYPMVMKIVGGERGQEINFGYDMGRFETATVERMLRHFMMLLREFGRGGLERPVATLPSLPEQERRQLLAWNGEPRPVPVGPRETIHGRIAAQIEGRGEALAVVGSGVELSYRELGRRANQLAHRLRQLGAGPEVLVGVAMERRVDLVVALLAILEAGAAYLPLDLSYPPDRLAFMLEDAAVPLLISQSHLAEKLPAFAGRTLFVDTEEERAAIAACPTERPAVVMTSDQLAYVIYTSGSTGKPKGVLIPHRNVLRLMEANQPWFDFGSDDVWTFFHSHAFDFSVWEIWGCLVTGGRLVVVPYMVSRNPKAFHALLAEEGVTVLNQTPSAFRQLIQASEEAPEGEGLALREVVFGGEALELSTLAPWYDRHGDQRPRLVNMYGITETTVHVTYRPLSRADLGLGGSPVGEAIPDLTIHLVDRRGEPVPIGVAGEMWVGGAGCARGYLGRPGLTAERFGPDPWSTEPGARIYRSGDLARYLGDGEIDFLGRIDHQVKIRGFRIELGEIEAVLAAQEGVRHAVVLAREDVPGDQRLVAYMVPRSGATLPDTATLRQVATETLPAYMVPSAFVSLDALPLTANGKLDRRALPAPEASLEEAGGRAPRTPLEELLVGMWCDVLGIPTMGIDDNVFELGAHSLLLTQMVSRVRKELEVELPLPLLFEKATVAELAAEVEAAKGSQVPPLEPVDRTGLGEEELPLSFAQERLWFLDQLLPGSATYNIPGTLILKGPLDVAIFRRAVGEIVQRHETLRTRFESQGGKPYQVIEPEVELDIPLEDLTTLGHDEGRRIHDQRAAEEAARPFDLRRAPLLRLRLYKLEERLHAAVVVMHHVVSDGWSMGVLLQELGALYRAFGAGQPSPLEPLTVQYADFAAWQRGWLDAGELERQLDIWRRRLLGAPTVLELPTDRPLSMARANTGGLVSHTAGGDLVPRVETFARRHDATPFMVLLGVFQAVLARLSGQDSVLVGSPIANRTRVETEGLIGFFVNTLVLRGDFAGNPAFAEILRRVREVTLEAYGHQDVPFERLVDELAPERSLDHSPLFQVMFSFQKAPPASSGGGEAGDELVIEPAGEEITTAKFNLNVAFHETADGLFELWSYKAEIFDRTTVERLRRMFDAALAAVLDDDALPFAELPLLGSGERHQLLVEWNQPRPDYRTEGFSHQLVMRQAEARPEAVALAKDGARWTYAQLGAVSGHLAVELQRLGVGPGEVVGICIDRSFEQIASILAVLRAGGAYMPLDPSYPRDRLALMEEDSGALVVLTTAALAERVAEGPHKVVVDAERALAAGGEPVEPRLDPDHPAYLIYTSGSTGRPKGVVISHRAMLNRLSFDRRVDVAEPGCRYMQFAPFGFDMSMTQIFPPMVSGGCLVLLDPENVGDPAYLTAVLEAEEITHTALPPVVLEAVLDILDPARVPTLRQVVSGGEALARSTVRRFEERLPGVKLINRYGPTEATVAVSSWPFPPGDDGRVPIGRPIAKSKLHIVDPRLRELPQGAVGELVIGGLSLAQGYLRRPGQSAGRFVPDPFPVLDERGPEGRRLYRTGDLARFRHDGVLEFMGRIDHQVKIRGHRVELGEIDTALAKHPAVREVTVVDLPDGATRRLAAYFVRQEGAELAEGELRTHLLERLPDYMLPSVFVELESLPLTPAGKVDRKALPAPTWSGGGATPETATEELVARLWGEVLGVEGVGRDDNFFDLGGHSLLATQAMARLREVADAELPLRTLFEAPTVAGLAERVDAARGLAATPRPPIEPVDHTIGHPLSFSQERLWFLDRLQPGSPLYNIPLVVRLVGRLDVAALEGALSAIVERHAVLRTVITDREGKALQRIVSPWPIELPVIDLGDEPAATRPDTARQRAAEESQRPFDLASGRLMRAALLRLGDDEHLAVITLHHIAADGWSMQVLVRELGELYQARVVGRPPALPELAVHYVDYAVWQRRRLDDEGELDRQLGWWRGQLASAPRALELPLDRPRPPRVDDAGAAHFDRWPRPLLDGLEAAARRGGTTLFVALLAAYQGFLSRLSGQRDLVVGTPIANREELATQGLIGFFVNTLALRGDLAGDPSFEQQIERSKQVHLGAQTHQEVPFERLVDELQPERDLASTPLFQVMLVLQNEALGDPALPGLRLETVAPPVTTSKFDITLSATPTAGGLRVFWEYRSSLFDATTIRRFDRGLRALVASVIEHPTRPLSTHELSSPAERQQILVEWNDAADSACARDTTLPALFETQVARTPDAVALEFDGTTWTYAELSERVTALAAVLVAAGVGPESLVGVAMERSFEMVTALYAIHRAGGAYVPIDPDHPAERIAFVLADAGVEVLLIQRALRSRLPLEGEGAPATVLEVETSALAEGGPVGPSVSPARSDHLAYVIYTSGSTGRPKGAMNSHRAIVNRLLWMQRQYGLGVDDRVLQKTPYSFDVSVWEFFWPLMVGARLVIARPGIHRDPAELARTLTAAGVTTLHFVPSMLQAFLDADDLAPEDYHACARTLRWVIASGEALSPELVRRFEERLGGDGAEDGAEDGDGDTPRLENLYGPTEAAVDVTSWSCAAAGAGRGVPIGRPVANTRIHVLDRNLRPVGLGVAGELLIAGIQLARGYHGRAGLTAERFVPDPLTGEPGARLYRTGDLVRYGTDGALDYLGRIDHQVKINGLRIELGEIEAALLAQPVVNEAVVMAVAKTGDTGGQRLVGWVVAAAEAAIDQAAIDETALRLALGERLPEYMIPPVLVTLDALPLLPNGKVDRKALLEGALPGVGEAGAGGAPETAEEKLLAEVWSEVLGGAELTPDAIGRGDNFFALGGDSIVSIQVIARARQRGLALEPQEIFRHPTLAAMAAVARRVEGSADIPRAPRDGDLPLSFAQRRLWFLAALVPDNPFYNMPASFRLRGPLEPAPLEAAFQQILERHEALRTVFSAPGGEPVQRVVAAGDFELSVTDLETLDESERSARVEELALAEAQTPFDLTAGRLLRARLLRLGPDDHVLLVTLHHIASDGWSMGILRRELMTLYQAVALGRPSPLPPLEIQYPDFAVWQQQTLGGEALEGQLDYWRRELAELPALLELPTDRPRPPVPSYRGHRAPLVLEPELAERLRRISQQHGGTVFMTLLASFQAFLWRLSGAPDIPVGTPIAGRRQHQLEPLIGFFVNTLVLRGRLAEGVKGRQLLDRTRETTLDAFAHQDLPFEMLVEALQPERSKRHSPIFQVMMVHQSEQRGALEPFDIGATGGADDGPPWTLESLGVEADTAKFDLTLTLVERGGTLGGRLAGSADLWDAASIERMAGHWRRLLVGLLDHPDHRLDALPLLGPSEREQLVVTWNRPREVYHAPELVHPPVAERALADPSRISVRFRGQGLTYGELLARGRRLARRLRQLGVGPETVVGVHLERSFELVVALYAVLEAGGCYLPLDPAMPRPRLAAMANDAKARVVLTDATRATDPLDIGARIELVPAVEPGQVVLGDDDRVGVAHDVTGDHPAYVIYTSGSTGTPKGVVVSHRSVANRLAWDCVHEIFAQTRYLQNTAVGFDMSVPAIFSPLWAGGTTVLLPSEHQQEPAAILELMASEGITRAGIPPLLLALMLEDDAIERCSALEMVGSGGDALAAEVPERFYRRLPGAELVNRYGPTEATVAVTTWTFPKGEAAASRVPGQAVAIGRPIAEARLHVVDPRLRLVPVGVPGELLIGGLCLARGYLGAPAATAEGFVPDPFAGEGASPAGARLYRTGDLVRQRDDGVLEFLGRIDDQVKIRGFRVELGEIEAVLRRQPSVRQAAVTVQGEGEARRLVAYVAGDDLEARALGRRLGHELPSYMVPSTFVVLDQLPISSAGKVDRRRLPAAEEETPTEAVFVAPRNVLEEGLVAIFAKVLERETVSVDDDFFALGGHSLLAARVTSRIRQELGYELPLARLFEAPTVAELAALLADPEALGAQETTSSCLVPLGARGEEAPFFCVHPVAGFALCYRDLARELGDEQPFFGIQSPATVGGPLPEPTVEHAARLYVEEIRRLQPAGPYYLGGWSFGGLVAYEMARLLEAEDQEVAFVGLIDSIREEPRARGERDEGERVLGLFEHFLHLEVADIRDELAGVEPGERLDYAVRRMRQTGRIEGIVDAAMVRGYLEVMDLYEQAHRDYQPEPWAGRVTFFQARERDNGLDDPAALWRGAAAEVEVHKVEGHHQTMVYPPHVESLARSLRECLARARARARRGADVVVAE